MGDPSAIEGATRRLQEALDSLESAMDRRAEADHDAAILTRQVHAFESDRSRLAAELDGAAARTRALETANREVATRLDQAIDSIRGMLDVYGRHDVHDR
jgi:septal ring factor EnvC (AmiA/AmiB activator)